MKNKLLIFLLSSMVVVGIVLIIKDKLSPNKTPTEIQKSADISEAALQSPPPAPSPILNIAENSPAPTTKFLPSCNTLTAPDAKIPEGFGPPWNVLSESKELTVRFLCEPNSVPLVTIGTGSNLQYIYQRGYQSVNRKWQTVQFTCGGKTIEGWCLGTANANISTSAEYVTAYTCVKVNDTWKCGCQDTQCAQNYWEIQGIQKPNN